MAVEMSLESIKSNLYVLFQSVHWYFNHLHTKRLKVSPQIKHQMCCVIADMVMLEDDASAPYHSTNIPFMTDEKPLPLARLLCEMNLGFFYQLCRQKTATDEHLWRQLEHSVTKLDSMLKNIFTDKTIATAMEACVI